MSLSARHVTALFVVCVLGAVLLMAPAASASDTLNETPDSGMPYVNGPVRAIATGPDGTTYIGGSFTYIGPETGAGVVVDPITARRYTLFAQVAPDSGGGVSTVISDGRGGFCFAGSFWIGRQWRVLAHLRADGSMDPGFRPRVYGVSCLALPGNTLFVGGHFTSVDGRARYHLVALDAATGGVKGWNAHLNGGRVSCLALSGKTLFVGGSFSASIAGRSRRSLAALDVGTGRLLPWDAALAAGSDVRTLAVSGSRLYVGGASSTTDAHPLLMATDVRSGATLDWDPFGESGRAEFGEVETVAVSDSTVYVGGYFTSIGGQARGSLAAVDASTGFVTPWDPSTRARVESLAVLGRTVYVAGSFTSIGGQARNGAAALDATTGLATAWDVGDPMSTWLHRPPYDSTYAGDGYVYVVARSDSRIYVGGSFAFIRGSRRSNLAAIGSDGSLIDWNPSADRGVRALAISGQTVYAGGTFRHVAGQRRDYIAALDAVSGQPLPWNPRADDAVNALAVSGSTVYAGGLFTRIGGSRRDFLAALGADGAATSWNPGAVSTAARSERGVRALAVSSTRVYAGGAFTAMGGERRKNIAAIDTARGRATAWNPGTDRVVWALALSGSRLYVGGSFARLGGKARSRLGAVDVDRGTTLPWNPRAGGAEADVRSLAVLGQTLYAGGWFTAMGGYRRNHLAAVSAGAGVVTPWKTHWAIGRIDALAVSGGSLWAGETLRTGASNPKPYLAGFSQTGP